MRRAVKKMILPNQTGNLHLLFQKRITELALTRELSLLQLNVGAIYSYHGFQYRIKSTHIPVMG